MGNDTPDHAGHDARNPPKGGGTAYRHARVCQFGAREPGRRDGSPAADRLIPILAKSLLHGGRTPVASGATPLVGTRERSARSGKFSEPSGACRLSMITHADYRGRGRGEQAGTGASRARSAEMPERAFREGGGTHGPDNRIDRGGRVVGARRGRLGLLAVAPVALAAEGWAPGATGLPPVEWDERR